MPQRKFIPLAIMAKRHGMNAGSLRRIAAKKLSPLGMAKMQSRRGHRSRWVIAADWCPADRRRGSAANTPTGPLRRRASDFVTIEVVVAGPTTIRVITHTDALDNWDQACAMVDEQAPAERKRINDARDHAWAVAAERKRILDLWDQAMAAGVTRGLSGRAATDRFLAHLAAKGKSIGRATLYAWRRAYELDNIRGLIDGRSNRQHAPGDDAGSRSKAT